MDLDEVYFTEKRQRLTRSLVNSMKVNIPIQRRVMPDQNGLYETTWKDFLIKINSVLLGVLLCPHVCKARINHQEELI